MTFGGPSREKTVLADVKVETFQTSVSVNNTDILKINESNNSKSNRAINIYTPSIMNKSGTNTKNVNKLTASN